MRGVRGAVMVMALLVGVGGVMSQASAQESLKGRGIVTAVNLKSKPPTVTLGAQGWELVLHVDPEKTAILKNNQPIKLSNVQPGDDMYATYDIRDKKNIAASLWAQTGPSAQTAQAATVSPAPKPR